MDINNFKIIKLKLKSFIDEHIAVSFDEHFYIHELINELQIPRPTCSSCNYLLIDNVDGCECAAWGRDNCAISDMTSNYINAPNKMGCIHHSDYEA